MSRSMACSGAAWDALEALIYGGSGLGVAVVEPVHDLWHSPLVHFLCRTTILTTYSSHLLCSRRIRMLLSCHKVLLHAEKFDVWEKKWIYITTLTCKSRFIFLLIRLSSGNALLYISFYKLDIGAWILICIYTVRNVYSALVCDWVRPFGYINIYMFLVNRTTVHSYYC